MTTEDRRHIRNGIWMCRDHGNLIDADFEEYSPDTLRAWKGAAERHAAESLKFRANGELPEGSTLLQLGSKNVFHATWNAITNREWRFLLIRPEIGSIETLKDYVSSFDPVTMGTPKGRLPWAREVGSDAGLYYAKYRDNLGLLSRLIKMEMIRLSLIPVSDGIAGEGPKPSLHFVKRFLNVVISSADLRRGMLNISVGLEWGNGEYWSGNVPIYVS